MVIKGINYDVGTRTGPYDSRPRFDPEITRADLRAIREDLHCDAVRVSGTDPERLLTTAALAQEAGLAVWLSPQLHDADPEPTLRYIRQCAVGAQSLGGELVFLLGCELTLFMRGILPGDTLFQRLRPGSMLRMKYLGTHNRPLNAFLARAAAEVRSVFTGPVSYAAAPIERVDWTPFDYVCLDYYRARRNRHDFAARLERHFQHGRPVVITEVGCCTYRGAEDRGAMGWSIVDRADRDRLAGTFVRDEQLQADEVMQQVGILERAGVAGVFVFTFSTPALPHRTDPARDLDMASYSVVRCADDGSWQPKALYHALARHNAG